jgi:hypothetical protein
VGQVTHGGEETCIKVLVGNLRGRGRLGYLGVDGRIIVIWISERLGGGSWTGFMWFRMGTGDGLLWMR